MTPTTTGVSRGWFATTQWSMIVSAGRIGHPTAQQALEQLCESYWLPLYSYVRRRGYSAEDAQDLTQEFFARFVQHNRVARADQQKGRFRSFLLTSFKNFLSDEWDKVRAQKRGGGMQFVPLQFETGEATYVHEPAENVTPEEIYERRWALTLLAKVLSRLKQEHEEDGKGELFTALTPCLIGERTAQPYAELAQKLGTTEVALKSAVHRLRKQYRQVLRQEIGNTVATEAEIEEELNYLFTVLSRR